MKRNAVPWSLRGIAMHRLACLLQVSGQAVRHGLRTVAKAHEAQPVPTGHPLVLGLEERRHYRHEPRQQRWIWKAPDRASGPRLDWAWGRRDQATRKTLVARLAPGEVQRSGPEPGGP